MENNDFLEKILSDRSPANRESFISMVKYISTYRLSEETAHLFQKIIDANIPEALDLLFKNKNPESYFSTLSPKREIIVRAIDTLVKYKPSELEEKALLATLGVLLAAYKKSSDGFSIYRLQVSDIHHIAKHLLKNEKKSADMIIEILESVWNYDNKNEVAVLSINIVNCFFDKNKKLSDVIPQVLLL